MRKINKKVEKNTKKTFNNNKILFSFIIISAFVLIASITLITMSIVDSNDILADIKINPQSAQKCIMPYTENKCRLQKNLTIRKIQQFLQQLYGEKYYTTLGYFNYKTTRGIMRFQADNNIHPDVKLDADGIIGPLTLKALAIAANSKTGYYEINYDLNGGTGTLNSSYGQVQIILQGISAQLSSTKLTLPGYVHVGWKSSLDNKRKDLGEVITVSKQKNGKIITMKALWCAVDSYHENRTVFGSTKICDEIIEDVNISAVMPVPVNNLNSWRSDLSRGFATNHLGIDFVKSKGTEIRAVIDGEVITASNNGSWNDGYGNYLVIKSTIGSNTYYLYYAHQKELAKINTGNGARVIQVGDKVKAGTVIGYVGNSGNVIPAPTPSNPDAGTHLHFELRVNCQSPRSTCAKDSAPYLDNVVAGKGFTK